MVLKREVSIAMRAAFAFSAASTVHDAERLLLVRPDDEPDVERHDQCRATCRCRSP